MRTTLRSVVASRAAHFNSILPKKPSFVRSSIPLLVASPLLDWISSFKSARELSTYCVASTRIARERDRNLPLGAVCKSKWAIRKLKDKFISLAATVDFSRATNFSGPKPAAEAILVKLEVCESGWTVQSGVLESSGLDEDSIRPLDHGEDVGRRVNPSIGSWRRCLIRIDDETCKWWNQTQC